MFANDHEKYVRIFFENPDNAVYGTEAVIAEVVRVMQGMKMLPSVVSARIVFDAMDLRDRATEVKRAQAAFEATVAEVASKPFARNELDYFSSLSRQDLHDQYFANGGYNDFRVRYDAACKQFGFVPPAPMARRGA